MTAQEAFNVMVKEQIAPALREEERKWHVSPDRPTDAVTEDFVATIRDHALPAMRKQMRAR